MAGFVNRLCERGVPRVVLLLPVDVRHTKLDSALRRIRAAQVNGTLRSQCGVAVATAGDMPTFVDRGRKLRRPDGFHMTRAGAEVVWQRARPTVMAVVDR